MFGSPVRTTHHYLYRQAREVREGGPQVLLRKSRVLVLLAPALLTVLLVRLLRPLLLIRFGGLASQRIGHYALDTEVYLCQRDAGMDGPRTFDIFYHGRTISNRQLKKMWERTLRFSACAAVLDRVNSYLPGGSRHTIRLRSWPSYSQDMHALVGRSGPHLTFTPEEEELGRAALRSLGLPDGAPLVCFHARDAAYLASAIPGNQWDYHNFRDASIQGYIPAAEELGRRGYFALRMGAVVKEQLNTTNPRIVDYATNHRSDFLDIFLCGKCEFFLGSHTGLYTVASMFRRPVALVNVVPIFEAPTWGPRDLFIPKKLWLRQERRFMTFREVFDSGVAEFQTTAQYQQLGIEVVENTAEEITALAVEMDERLKGAWQTTEEDEALQARFWALFKVKQWHGPVVSRIGAEFLRHNQALLV